ncbi:Nramp family divalent metal transporter [Carboxydothermus hydrogenoformans]|uniref:Putative manganese transpoter n=1 Tax=Carboxydothermus hydrogenoformans (strain ATCC BAA-161 / DSM 6008 / Z-2901) TaxID=246194 RepID=Q3ABN3_CARHZ|nr:Nramp family divalent metal transporter [Carboxydothermus hydrogenoformans]ABB15257.1 putative manganese transpoter [Carboxydothermus hydrogenoformans Z-2901]
MVLEIKARSRFFYKFTAFMGPAFLVSIGYIDPGNWAANFAGGSRYGSIMLITVLLCNFLAILFQSLVAYLTLKTGKSLAENIVEKLPKPLVAFYGVLAVTGAMATDVAEFVGAALGFSLILGLDLLKSVIIAVVFVVCGYFFERQGNRKVEFLIMGFLAAIGFTYLMELLILKPKIYNLINLGVKLDGDFLFVVLSMLGATVMPHNLFLHSDLIAEKLKQRIITTKDFPVVFLENLIALNLAFLVNSAMIVVAKDMFYDCGVAVDSLRLAYHTLEPVLNGWAALIFGLALVLCGLSSSLTGTIAGQNLLEKFLPVNLSALSRKMIIITPALYFFLKGLGEIELLLLSQVVLSFVLPFVLIVLLWFLNNIANKYLLILGWFLTAIIGSCNVILLWTAIF